MRKCTVTTKDVYYDATFHCWSHESWPIDASPLIGGHPGGIVEITYAIVEDAEGKVHKVLPECIKFSKEDI